MFSNQSPMNPISKPKSTVVTLLIAAGVFAIGLMWTGYSSFDERVITVRYLMFALAAFISFSTPYLLFPDGNTPVLQLGNVSGSRFQRYLASKILHIYWPVYLLLAVLLFGDLHTPGSAIQEKFIYLVIAYLILSGMLLIAVRRYIKSGPDSQFWKESDRGRELRVKMADYFKFPLDPGSIPSLINTIIVMTAGTLIVVVAALVSASLGIMFELAVALLFFSWGLAAAWRFKDRFEQTFYSSNAFFREFFRVNIKGEEVESSREVQQLWWVPSSLKAHVWQYLVQLDRKIPSGRMVAGGHLLIWFMAYQRPEPEFLTVLWIIFGLIHHLLIVMTFKQEISPSWLLTWIGNKSTWVYTRFWMQLRWIVPLLISMNLQYFIFGTPGFPEQGLVIIIYIIAGLGVSLVGLKTLKNEFNNQ